MGNRMWLSITINWTSSSLYLFFLGLFITVSKIFFIGWTKQVCIQTKRDITGAYSVCSDVSPSYVEYNEPCCITPWLPLRRVYSLIMLYSAAHNYSRSELKVKSRGACWVSCEVNRHVIYDLHMRGVDYCDGFATVRFKTVAFENECSCCM